MKQILFILTIFLSISCGQTSDTKNVMEQNPGESEKQKEDVPVDIALNFINSYVDNCNKMNKSIGIVEWINASNVTTNNFKTELKRIVEEASKTDPEMGLNADPIFDAQDYPDNGFELESFDNKTNFIVVKGKGWPDFKLTMKVILENNNWLVDGCGIINIPKDRLISK